MHGLFRASFLLYSEQELFAQKKLSVEGMLDPIVKFGEVIKGYRMIDEEPENTAKLGPRCK